jgi:hypothetical protein
MKTKTCQNCKKDFGMDADELGFYERIKVPPPLICPLCRQQQRMLFRNFKTLYKRPSSLSGTSIVSMYAADVLFPVYEATEWWGETWEGLNYGRDIDWSAQFFPQLQDLFNQVPHMALMNTKSVNCDYSNMTYESKNCYLVFGCVSDEDCSYGHITWNSRDTLDTLYAFKGESCYESTDILSCNKVFYSQETENCADSMGLFDCRGCTDCIGCVGLNNKSYHIFNENVGREAYKKFLEENPIHKPETISMILAKREELRRTVPQRAFFGSHNVDVSGNHIYFSKNIHDSFDIKGGEDSRYCYTMRRAVQTYDAGFSPDLEDSYQVLNGVGARIIGSHLAMDSHDIYYSDHCFGSHDLFGCFGLRQKSYCIFNKQYSKEEYEKLVPKLIEHMKANGEWGGFFPKEMSPFAYNESIVNEYMPLSKEEALAQGFRWRDDIPATRGQGTIAYEALPKEPSAYTDELTKEVLTCKVCEKNYRLTQYEISFYQRMSLALPAQCFNCRHESRMHARNPRQLWDATCSHCSKHMRTSYTPENQEIYSLYCEECYQQEML